MLSLDAYEWCYTAVFRHQSTSACSIAFDSKDVRRLDFLTIAAAPVGATVTRAAVVLFVVVVVDAEDVALLVTGR